MTAAPVDGAHDQHAHSQLAWRTLVRPTPLDGWKAIHAATAAAVREQLEGGGRAQVMLHHSKQQLLPLGWPCYSSSWHDRCCYHQPARSCLVLLLGLTQPQCLTRPTWILDCFSSTARACQVGSSCWHCSSRWWVCASILLAVRGSI
jgi:hypothetical protein